MSLLVASLKGNHFLSAFSGSHSAETLDGVAELPDTQTALQTDVKEIYFIISSRLRLGL